VEGGRYEQGSVQTAISLHARMPASRTVYGCAIYTSNLRSSLSSSASNAATTISIIALSKHSK